MYMYKHEPLKVHMQYNLCYMYGYELFFGGVVVDILFKWLHDLDLFFVDGGWWVVGGPSCCYVSVHRCKYMGGGPPALIYISSALRKQKNKKKKM